MFAKSQHSITLRLTKGSLSMLDSTLDLQITDVGPLSKFLIQSPLFYLAIINYGQDHEM